MDVGLVFSDGLRRILFYFFKILQLLLIFLVNVVQVFTGDQALETLIFLQLSGEESCWGIVILAIDAQCGLRELLFSIKQECFIDNLLF